MDNEELDNKDNKTNKWYTADMVNNMTTSEKNVTTLEQEIEENHIIKKMRSIIERIDIVKNKFYPKNLNMKKVYMVDAPTKHDFVHMRSNMRTLMKDVQCIIKQQYKKNNKNKKKLKNGCGFLRMVKLKPKLAKFIDTHNKGLDNIYCDALLMSYFTNYFFTMKCKNKAYVIPNKELIDLFWDEFIQQGVIDNNGNLLNRTELKKNGQVINYKGFKFIHSRRMLKNHIMVDKKGKLMVIPNNTNNNNIVKILENESKILNQIKILRQEYDDLEKNIIKKNTMRNKAMKLGDLDDFNDEINKINNEKNDKIKKLKQYCEKHNFPCCY